MDAAREARRRPRRQARLAALRREEDAAAREAERLEADKARHARALRRARDEEASRFACGRLLHERYLLQRLLGKGGFSEVFQARTGCFDVALDGHALDGLRQVFLCLLDKFPQRARTAGAAAAPRPAAVCARAPTARRRAPLDSSAKRGASAV